MPLKCTARLHRWQSHGAGQYMKANHRGSKGDFSFFFPSFYIKTFHREYNQLPSTHTRSLIHSHMPEQQNICKYYLENDHSYSQSIYSSIVNMERFILKTFVFF